MVIILEDEARECWEAVLICWLLCSTYLADGVQSRCMGSRTCDVLLYLVNLCPVWFLIIIINLVDAYQKIKSCSGFQTA